MTAEVPSQPLKVVAPDDAAPPGEQLTPPPIADPEPETGDPEPEESDPATPNLPAVPSSAAVATSDIFDATEAEPNWPYAHIEFLGDKLGVRVPTRTALAGFSMSTGSSVDEKVKSDLSNFFVAKHLSMASYGRVFSRMMDPDEESYTMDTIGKLFNDIVFLALTDAEKAAIAEAEAETAAKEQAELAKTGKPPAAIA